VKIQVSLKSGKNKGYFNEDQYIFFITLHSVLLRMRNLSDKNYRKNQTHILCSITFFENRAVLR